MNSQEIAAEGSNQRNTVDDVNLDKSKYVENVKENTSDDDEQGKNLDGEKQDNTEILMKKDNLEDIIPWNQSKERTIQDLLSDWKTAIPSQPRIKQPGGQGDDRRKKCPKINQAYLFLKVRFLMFQNNHNSKKTFYLF